MVTLKAERGVVESFEERNCVVCTTSFNFNARNSNSNKKLFTSFYRIQYTGRYRCVCTTHTPCMEHSGTLILYNILQTKLK